MPDEDDDGELRSPDDEDDGGEDDGNDGFGPWDDGVSRDYAWRDGEDGTPLSEAS